MKIEELIEKVEEYRKLHQLPLEVCIQIIKRLEELHSMKEAVKEAPSQERAKL